MLNKLKNEPVLLTATLVAIINLCVGLGYLSQSEGDAVVSMLESVIVLILGFVARSQVTPSSAKK